MKQEKSNIILLAVLIVAVAGYFYFFKDQKRLPWGTPVFYDGGDYVSAKGSWISDSSNRIIAWQKINTTDVSCSKSRMLCIEARAFEAPTGSLLSQKLEYEIRSWTPQEIVAVLDGLAGTIELRFDRTKKIVTMIDSEKAEIEGASTLPAYAHLGGGPEAVEANKK